jgi:hypothetical protein
MKYIIRTIFGTMLFSDQVPDGPKMAILIFKKPEWHFGPGDRFKIHNGHCSKLT